MPPWRHIDVLTCLGSLNHYQIITLTLNLGVRLKSDLNLDPHISSVKSSFLKQLEQDHDITLILASIHWLWVCLCTDPNLF